MVDFSVDFLSVYSPTPRKRGLKCHPKGRPCGREIRSPERSALQAAPSNMIYGFPQTSSTIFGSPRASARTTMMFKRANEEHRKSAKDAH